MKKMLVAMLLIVSATVFISGCTSWNGITKTDKPGTYYVVTNKQLFPFGVRPGILACTVNTTGTLNCEPVVVNDWY
jgi:hypothetical protein